MSLYQKAFEQTLSVLQDVRTESSTIYQVIWKTENAVHWANTQIAEHNGDRQEDWLILDLLGVVLDLVQKPEQEKEEGVTKK